MSLASLRVRRIGKISSARVLGPQHRRAIAVAQADPARLVAVIGPAGSAGAPGAYVGPVQPSAPGPWAWWRTDPANGQIIDLVVEDGL